MPQPPNIIFIMADDLGYADLSCCGRRDFVTPNIDRIAERGMRLTQGYANSAVCSATRLALITGRYQYRLPLGLEEPLAGNRDVGLPPEHPTLPSRGRGRPATSLSDQNCLTKSRRAYTATTLGSSSHHISLVAK